MMQFRSLLWGAVLATGLSAITGSTLFANTVVQQIDADTLRVVEYSGKPPFKRRTISQASNPVLYARYADRIGYDPQPLFAVERRGAPGKSLPGQARRVSADAREVAEFARFEETGADEQRSDGRMWRGAPGKARALRR